MSLTVNLRHLEAHSLRLKGELPLKELDIDTLDQAIQLREPLDYDIEAQKLEGGLFLAGKLELVLQCQCVRCLKPFTYRMNLEDWTVHLPLRGEDAVPVANDCVDLTPFLREDILLAFPQHPLCAPECRGLPAFGRRAKHSSSGQPGYGSPAWNELNKLKF